MPNGSDTGKADALSMARAILGGHVRIIGASLSGGGEGAGLREDGAAILSGATDGTPRSAYIDIDFIPEGDHLALSALLSAEDVPVSGSDRLLSDGLTIWINGKRQSSKVSAGAAGAGATADLPIASDPTDGLRIGLRAILGVWKSRVNSIRIATRALGAGAVLSTLAIRAEAMGQGKAVGNPGTGNNGNDAGNGNAGGAPGQGGGGGNGGGNGGGGNFDAVADSVDIWEGASVTVDLRLNDIGPGNSEIFVTAINGEAVEVGVPVDLGNGETLVLNEDGTVTITADASGVIQGGFTYTASYGTGNAQQTDTAQVTLNTVPCFVAGTSIRTPNGPRKVEMLDVGDLVLTRDDGPQEIRWIGSRRLPAEGDMAPIEIEPNTFGTHGRVRVSPLHRILVRNESAELLFGSNEVLIAARDLVDGIHVRQVEGGYVDYVHILFDRHQVIWSNGLLSESFLPGPQTTDCFEKEIIDEIRTIFPDLDPETGRGYGPAARPTLRRYEARLLVA